jgi:hypothetical protein
MGRGILSGEGIEIFRKFGSLFDTSATMTGPVLKVTRQAAGYTGLI